MITTQSDLDLTREQLARAEHALEVIRREVRPLNEARYRLMAESYVEQIRDLRSQIDAYLGIDEVLTPSACLMISLEGEHVRLGETAVGALTRTLDTFRRGLQALVELTAGRREKQRASGRRPRWIEQICDLPLVGVQPGSVQVLLGEPDTGNLFSDEDIGLLRDNLAYLFRGLQWATEESGGVLQELSGDPDLRYTILSVVRSLVPPRGGSIEAVGFRANGFGPPRTLRLRNDARNKLNSAMAEIEHAEEYTEVSGTMREIDLDSRTFSLRDRPNGQPDLQCHYSEAIEAVVKAFLDEPVVVTGLLSTSRRSKHQSFEVEMIEADTANEARPGECR